MDRSNGIYVIDDDDPTISRVYCKACDRMIETPTNFVLSRHSNNLLHKEVLDTYNEMASDNELKNYSLPYEAARCKYEKKALYEILSNNNIQDVDVRLVDCIAQQRKAYKCMCFCSICQKEIPSNLRSIQRHINRNDHKKDSRGFAKEEFNLDLCKLFMKREYEIVIKNITSNEN